MPLILLVGYPSSGKSSVTDILVGHVERSRPNVKTVVIRDQNLATFNKSIYGDSGKEKEHRGYLRSLVQQSLTDETLVIVDSLNYIKGFRYELYCGAKLAKTTYCVIFCDTDSETAHQFNWNRENVEDRYDDDTMEALIGRLESPDSRNRWDSPLFTVHPTLDPKWLENMDLDQILACIFDGHRLQPNQSTQTQPLSSTNFLFELDSLTQTIVQSLMEAQKNAVPGDMLTVHGTEEKVEIKKMRTLAELTRLRRQFITYTKTHPVTDRAKLASMFVTFINNS